MSEPLLLKTGVASLMLLSPRRHTPMEEWVGFTSVFVGIALLAVVLLAWRDIRQHRLRDRSRTVDERIQIIHETASFNIQQLQDVLERRGQHHPELASSVPPLLGYYHRLQSLSADMSSSPDESLQLADEATRFIAEHRMKGVFVDKEARKLAELLRLRDAAT